MATDHDIRIDITANGTQAERELKNVGKGVDDFGASAVKAGAALAAAVGGFSAIKDYLTDSVSTAADYEERFLAINAAIEATGGSAGFTADEIRKMSQELALGTLASVEGAEKAATKLLTFKSVAGDTFKTALTLAQDLAQAGFGTLETNAIQLGKALEDPVKGLSALSRSGVSFSQTQTEVIKKLVETGKQAEAQALILEAIAGQVGGVGEAAAKGVAGALDTMNQRFEEAKRATGEAIQPELTQFYNDVSEALVMLTGNMDLFASSIKVVMSSVKTVTNVLQIGFGNAAKTITDSLATINEVLASLTFGEVSENFTAMAKEFRSGSAALAKGIEDDWQDIENAWKSGEKVSTQTSTPIIQNVEAIANASTETAQAVVAAEKTIEESKIKSVQKSREITRQVLEDFETTAERIRRIKQEVEDATPSIYEKLDGLTAAFGRVGGSIQGVDETMGMLSKRLQQNYLRDINKLIGDISQSMVRSGFGADWNQLYFDQIAESYRKQQQRLNSGD